MQTKDYRFLPDRKHKGWGRIEVRHEYTAFWGYLRWSEWKEAFWFEQESEWVTLAHRHANPPAPITLTT